MTSIEQLQNPNIYKRETALHAPVQIRDLIPAESRPQESGYLWEKGILYPYKIETTRGQEFVAILDTPLNKSSFMELLSSITPPETARNNSRGVLDDWIKISTNLRKKHASGLGQHWTDFMEHLDIFTQTLAWRTDALQRIQSPKLIENRFFRNTDLTWFTLAQGWDAEVKLKFRNFLEQLHGTEVFRKSLSNGRIDVPIFYANLSEQEQNQVLMSYFLQNLNGNYEFAPLLMDERGRPFSAIPHQPIRTKFIDDRQVEVCADGFFKGTYIRDHTTLWDYNKFKAGTSVWKAAPNTLKCSNIIVPVLHWVKRDDGSIELDVSPFAKKDERVRTILSQWTKYYSDQLGIPLLNTNRLNSYLGNLLLGVYYLPALRKDQSLWPTTQSFHPGGVEQEIMEAQIPVQAAQARNYIAQAPLFVAIENLFTSV